MATNTPSDNPSSEPGPKHPQQEHPELEHPNIAPQRRRISSIWILPLVALLIGLWMVYYNWSQQGPLITISFVNAEGIEPTHTKVKTRNVEVGLVEQVALNEKLDSVLVTVRLKKEAEHLIQDDTYFWVVKPRIDVQGISGLGTLLSGIYIELAPGTSGQRTKQIFNGLESPPLTPAGTPGLRLNLYNDSARSSSAGSPVIYNGFSVGRIESVKLDPKTRQVNYSIFINEPYNNLVTTNTKFWDISGVKLTLDTEGVSLTSGSLASILSGGIAFGVPANIVRGEPVLETRSFRLYTSAEEAKERPYAHYQDYVLLFNHSVRGLRSGAPVEYRGIRIGTVKTVNYGEINSKYQAMNRSIPVLIRIEPGRIGMGDTKASVEEMDTQLPLWVAEGLNAKLGIGNLLTGNLFIDLNFDNDRADSPSSTAMPLFQGYRIIPTSDSGLIKIEQQIQAVLEKIQDLPLEETIEQASKALEEASATLASLQKTSDSFDELLNKKSVQRLPNQVNRALAQLSETLKGYSPDSPVYIELNRALTKLTLLLDELQPLAREVKEQPNTLLFGNTRAQDPEPKGRQQ
ncbi:MAG: intermembrane transport protein PqiB [Chromatiales bacterium]|nr:intermembrane transport protein PqiB [Chromatiales bacterium]